MLKKNHTYCAILLAFITTANAHNINELFTNALGPVYGSAGTLTLSSSRAAQVIISSIHVDFHIASDCSDSAAGNGADFTGTITLNQFDSIPKNMDSQTVYNRATGGDADDITCIKLTPNLGAAPSVVTGSIWSVSCATGNCSSSGSPISQTWTYN